MDVLNGGRVEEMVEVEARAAAASVDKVGRVVDIVEVEVSEVVDWDVKAGRVEVAVAEIELSAEVAAAVVVGEGRRDVMEAVEDEVVEAVVVGEGRVEAAEAVEAAVVVAEDVKAGRVDVAEAVLPKGSSAKMAPVMVP